jgi:hypothetical protein
MIMNIRGGANARNGAGSSVQCQSNKMVGAFIGAGEETRRGMQMGAGAHIAKAVSKTWVFESSRLGEGMRGRAR